jgi:hypothetical protein
MCLHFGQAGGEGGLAGAKWVNPKDFRHLCDRCAGSIDDLHRTCSRCEADLCVHCCREAAAAGRVRSAPCPCAYFGVGCVKALAVAPGAIL